MKAKRFKLKSIILEIDCKRINNGFAFTPLSIFKCNINVHKYLCIIIDLIKITISINFIWKRKEQ